MKIDTTQFTGTSAYHRLPIWGLFLTDGAKYVADEAGAYWLMDEIGAAIEKRGARNTPHRMGDGFLVVRLKVNEEDRSAVLTFENGNHTKVCIDRKIPYTDYPDHGLMLFVQYSYDPKGWVVMVPSEY